MGAGGEGRCSAEPQHQGTDAAPADLGNATDVPAHPRRGQHAQHEEGERHTEDDVRRVHALHVHAPPPALRAPRALRAPSVAAPKAALLPSRHRTPSVAAAAGYALSASSHSTHGEKGKVQGGRGEDAGHRAGARNSWGVGSSPRGVSAGADRGVSPCARQCHGARPSAPM